MAKVDHRHLAQGKKVALEREIMKIFSSLGLNEQGLMLLSGILTDSEEVMIARRLQVARRLLRGETTNEIRDSLNVGQEVISSTDRWLRGLFPQYRRLLPLFKKEKNFKSLVKKEYGKSAALLLLLHS